MWVLEDFGWLACGVYATIPFFWLMIHPFAERWRGRSRSPFRVLTPAWVLMWIVVWAASAPWRHALLYDAHWTWLLVPPLWTISLYIYFGGNRHFTVNQVIGRNELEPERHEPSLVTTGLHSRMRHPLYFGHLCTMLGWTIGTATIATLALTVFAVLSGIFLIRTEDAELERRFGVSYREYKQRVPAVVPHFRA